MRLILLAIAAVTCTAVTHAQVAAPLAERQLTRDQVLADLVFFRDVWGPKDRSYSDANREAMRKLIDTEIARAQPMRTVDLALTFERAMALSGNNHTHTRFFNEPGSFSVVPVSFWWFPEGAIVTRAHPDHADLLGARIVSIGRTPIQRALENVRPFISGTEDTVRYESPKWLRRLEVLRRIGLADGKRARRTLTAPPTPSEPDRASDPAQYSTSWRGSMVPGRGPDPWPHVLERLPTLPLYAQKPAGMTSAFIDDGRVLYVRSNAVYPTGEETSIESLTYDIIDKAVNAKPRPRNVVLDVRYNEGGNFLSIIPFVEALVRLTPPDGRIYVITGRGTNSAAIVLASMLKGHAPDRTLFVGEHPSDNARFYAEGGELTTPAGISLRYADGLHDWGAGCNDLDKCYWPGVLFGVAVGSLTPDIPVQMTYAQFASGADPALDAALADLAKRREDTKPKIPPSTTRLTSTMRN